MTRRSSLRAMAAGVLVAALPGVASVAREVKRVGVLGRPGGLIDLWKQGFPKEFAAHGFVEGRNLALDWFDVLLPAERELGSSEAVGRMIAARMARAGLDCMITHADPGTRYLKEVTRTIPIVTDVPDPVAAGFARSLSRPGGNITGLHQGGAEISLKNVELLRRLVPDARCAAWIGWAGFHERMKSFEAAALALGIRTRMAPIKEIGAGGVRDLRMEFAALRKNGCVVAVVEVADDVLWKEVSALALEHRIAIAAGSPVDEGVLLYYTAQRSPEHRSVRRIPAIAARILRGVRPEDIPFEGPTRYELFLNIGAAARIGITIPPDVLMQADHVIR